MVFSDQAFLFGFLPIALALILTAIRLGGLGLAVIFAVSALFLYWTAGILVLPFFWVLIVAYFTGVLLTRFRGRWVLACSIALLLLPLLYFKYLFFAVSVVYFGHSDFGGFNFVKSIALPIGISFYTFQGISYVLDVWRRDTEAERNVFRFAAYLSFFPHMIAGPIIRYRAVAADFRDLKPSWEMFAGGAARFLFGLLKKVAIADLLAPIGDASFGHPEQLTLLSAWLGVVAYTGQIYFDFSGYSDMAIGLARMCGIRFQENFNHPYAASTVTEFWRRWHISLSSWFRDYLYIPLGGNRKGRVRTYLNLLLVFAATGLWHGANLTFLLWGLWHGAFLVLERLLWGKAAAGFRSARLRYLYLLPVILLSWTIFRSTSLGNLGLYVAAMVGFGPTALDVSAPVAASLSLEHQLALAGAIVLVLGQAYFPALGPIVGRDAGGSMRWWRTAFVAAAAVAAAVMVLPQSFAPFIYFRF
jgi:alginate O-acetyltransferase complex protein AlgI